MEDVENTSPQHDFVQYGDSGEHGELDLNYGGLLPEEVEEQEPEASPLHRVPAAYEESPPPRSRHTSQPRNSNKEAAVVAKEHRPISFLEWQKQTKHGDGREDPLTEGTARSSRHRDISPRRREPEGSRHQETSTANSREDRRRHDPQPRPSRESPRRRAPSPERRRPASRSCVDERRVMIVPKYVDINHGMDRRPRLDRPARSGRDRTRSPHTHRSPLPARADHPAAYERRRGPEVARHTQHVPTRHAPEPAWPELHAPPSGRKVEDFVRPHLDRAPIRAPAYTWDAVQYDRASHSTYPAPAEYEYRHGHGQSEYRGSVSRDASYRAPLYREAAYGDAGGAAQGREVGYRQPSYDYDEPAYRDYRSMDLPHSSYARADTTWDAPRFADSHHDAYPHGYSAPEDRWTERDLRQLPARGSPRLARADRGSPRLPRAERDPVSLSRNGSYPYSRQDRGHDYLASREEPRHAPRLAHEYAAPPPRSFRNGLHQGSRDNRDARPGSVSRHVEEYAAAGGHLGDPYASRRPPPPPTTSRRPSPRGRSPRRRERSPARDTHRHHEVTRPSHHESDRPSNRHSLDRRPSDRAEPAGREALQLTSRSFAMDAAAAASRPASASEPAEPGQLDAADLPPPPAGDASKAVPPEAAKPSRASVPVRPDAATDPRAAMKEGGETSPVLNVQQGFLSEETPAARDRPFQRGQKPQPPNESTAGKPRERAGREGGSRKESERRSSREQAAEGKGAHKASAAAEAKHDREPSGGKGWGEPGSRHKEASDRPQEGDITRSADAKAVHGKRDEPSKKVYSADRDERQNIKPSSGEKDTPKAGLAHASQAAKASTPAKARTSTSKDRPASERKPDPKKAPRSPTKAKADVAADKGNKAAGKVGSRGEVVTEKQAGRKRRSRSAERSRSPKRNASSVAARKSGKETDRHESRSGGKEQPLPPPPARPGRAANDADLPPPPIRLNRVAESQQAGESPPDGGWSDQALPPPPPKPHSTVNKESTSSRANGDVSGHAQHHANTAVPSKEDKPASKPDAAAAVKDASAKDASAKGAPAKGAADKDVSAKVSAAKDVSAKDPSAQNDPAKVVSSKDAPARDSSAKAASKKPERESSAGRTGHKAHERSSDKGHIVARDSRKYGDRPSNGRSGQKRARSRSPQKPVEGSKAASSTKRQAKATDSKQEDGKHSALQNGTSERSKDADKESRKEWMYEEKGKTLGPVSKKRLHELWQKFKTDSKSKAADYLRFPVWRDGSRRAKQQVRDILTV